MESLEVSTTLPVDAPTLYAAWLSSSKHSAFTGGEAEISPKVGSKFTAWDGYISGETVILEPDQRIVQRWRTTEFADHDPDSELEIILEETEGGTRILLRHTKIPAGQAKQYEKGWEDHYFAPMREYFR